MFIAEFNNDYRVLLDISENTTIGEIETIVKLYYRKYYKRDVDYILYHILKHSYTINGEVTVNVRKIDDFFSF